MVAANRGGVTPELRQHLREFDDFYVPALYEGRPWDALVVGRLLTAAALPGFKTIQKRTRRPGSHAMVIARRIFEQMHDEVAANGYEGFVLRA